MKNNFLFLFFCLFFFGTSVYAQEILLPDQTFTVKVLQKISGEKPINSPEEELVIFSNGISSSFTKKDGFLTAAIVSQNEDKTNLSFITFSAACTNAKNCALKWSCTINEDKIEGKAEKFFMGKLISEYIFSGNRKKKK